jgi:hypothetical protein
MPMPSSRSHPWRRTSATVTNGNSLDADLVARDIRVDALEVRQLVDPAHQEARLALDLLGELALRRAIEVAGDHLAERLADEPTMSSPAAPARDRPGSHCVHYQFYRY